MVGISFSRPVGPYADSKELEYVSSLHQTSPDLRQDGTITAKDIMYFLSSRHGIQVEEDAVRSSIITELCGTPPVENSPSLLAIDSAKGALAKLSEGSCSDDDGTKEDEESEDEDDAPVPAMDIAQMLSLLLIPFLRDGNSDGKNQEAVGSVVEIALDTIWAELMSHSMDVSSSSAGGGSGRVLVTPELLREIMAIFGEVEVSDEMLEGMVAAAAGGTNQKNGQFYLTKSSFLRALTGDVQLFNPNVNESDTTHFDDARIAAKKRDPSITEKEDSSMVVFTSVYTAANIDNNADTYRSTGWFTLVWTSTIFVYFMYMLQTGSSIKLGSIQGCDESFGCQIALSIANFALVFLELMILGLLWIMVANFGNSTDAIETICQKFGATLRILLGMLLVCTVTVLSFFYEVDTKIFNSVKVEESEAGYYIVLVMGLCIMLLQASRILSVFTSFGCLTAGGTERKEAQTKRAATVKVQQIVDHATLLHVPPPGEEDADASSSLRKSSVSSTVRDVAKSLHGSRKYNTGSSTAKVMLNYSNIQDATEEIGGVIWTLKRVLNGTLFEEEGIFLHGRLLAINLMQFLVSCFMIGAFVFLYHELDEFLGRKDDHCDYRIDGLIVGTTDSTGVDAVSSGGDDDGGVSAFLDALEGGGGGGGGDDDGFLEWKFTVANLNSTHFTDGNNIVQGQIDEALLRTGATICWDFYAANLTTVTYDTEAVYNEMLDTIDIEKWEYTLASVIGLIGAMLSAFTIAAVYIPSFVSSVIKLRSGFSPSLKGNSQTFLCYRKSPDSAAILWGSAFWGVLFSAGICFLFFGGIAFVCAYSKTRPYVKTIVAGFIGIFCTTAIKMVAMMILRPLFYGGAYYRKRVAASNITNVVLEVWSLGLSIGTVTTRAIKLALVTCFYLGRIDTPMLAPGVGYVAGSPLDPAPIAFKKDLLIHEAHRHPYIERLGLLYMLKLRNGKDFGSQAGAGWRMLFVLALLPWMRNYRVVIPQLGTDRMLLVATTERGSMDGSSDEGENEALVEMVSWTPTESIRSLAAKRSLLKQQLKDLNNILSQKLSDTKNHQAKMNVYERHEMLQETKCDNSYVSTLSV